MMIRGFFTTFLMKQRLGIFGFGKASLGLGLLLISINSDLSGCKSTNFPDFDTKIFKKSQHVVTEEYMKNLWAKMGVARRK